MHSRSRMTIAVLTLAPLQCRDGARRVFTDGADSACNMREMSRNIVRCSASRMKGELHPTKSHLRGGLPHLVRTSLHVG